MTYQENVTIDMISNDELMMDFDDALQAFENLTISQNSLDVNETMKIATNNFGCCLSKY